MERTLMLIKPDGVQRGIVGEILRRVELKGLRISAMKLLRISPELAKKHYAEHLGKPFYPNLESYIISGPVIALVVEGESAVELVRKLNGSTNPLEASPGTIRGDFGIHKNMNLVHGSDTVENAEREIHLFFEEKEITSYERAIDPWI